MLEKMNTYKQVCNYHRQCMTIWLRYLKQHQLSGYWSFSGSCESHHSDTQIIHTEGWLVPCGRLDWYQYLASWRITQLPSFNHSYYRLPSQCQIQPLHCGQVISIPQAVPLTLPPIIMEMENGVLEDVFISSLQMGYSSTSMLMGGRLEGYISKISLVWGWMKGRSQPTIRRQRDWQDTRLPQSSSRTSINSCG